MMMLAFALPLLLVGLLVGDDDDTDAVGASMEGTPDDDMLTGTADSELISGNAGNDMLRGLDGNDTLFGNAGTDVLIGDGGDDMLCAGDDDDFITGNRGFDTIEGQGGDDWVSGDYNNDTVRGDEGNDTVMGGRGQDVLGGGEGDDVLYGGILTGIPLEADDMQALADGETLESVLEARGFELNMRDDMRQDEIYGGTGDDTLFIGGLDNAYGGNGADTFNIMADHTGAMSTANINDYTPGEDNVGIVVNDGEEEMEIIVSEDGEDAIVMGDGQVLARVAGAAGTLSVEDISVMSESSVAGMLDPNA